MATVLERTVERPKPELALPAHWGAPTGTDTPPEEFNDMWRWNVERVQEAVAAGTLREPERFELIGGVLLRKMPKGPQHSIVFDLLSDALK